MASKANLQYLKAVRTRFYNVLEKEVSVGQDLLCKDMDNMSLEECKDNKKCVAECKLKLNTYIEKLSVQSGKLAEALGDTDEDLTNTIINGDSALSENALAVSYKLQIVEEDLADEEKEKKDFQLSKAAANEDFHRMVEHQMKLQNKFFEQQETQSELQMKLQQDFLDSKSSETTKVKLPKIDIITFNGNKLQWLEFWDSFETAVHNNKGLSAVDKFNYLRGKLTGEARNAISGLSLSNENYDVAVKILRDRYGDVQEIIDIHYDKLINIAPARNTTDSLRSFLDKIERHLRSLDVLKENIDQKVFISMIRRKLPSDVLLQLEVLKGVDNIWSVSTLREVLRQFIVSKEKSGKSVGTESSPQNQTPKHDRYNNKGYQPRYQYNGRNYHPAQNRTETLVAAEKQNTPSQFTKRCTFCNSTHWSDECSRYKTVQERKQRLKGCCYKCLKDNHLSKECKSSRACVYCGQKDVHHRSLCVKKFGNGVKKENAHLSEEVHSNNEESASKECELLSFDETVMMQTATTNVTKGSGCNKSETVRLLLDSGSHRTYITKSLADRLELEEKAEQTINVVTFGSEKARVIKTKSTTLDLKLKDGRLMTISANIVPNISGTINRYPVEVSRSERFAELTRHLQMADTIPTDKESETLELLIGNDYYLDLMNSEKIEVNPGLYLVSSKLGWILSGRARASDVVIDDDISMLILTHGESVHENSLFTSVDSVVPTKPDLESFWNVESIGIVDPTSESDDDKAMECFKRTLKRESDRYQVTWPWKEDIPDLPENRGLALGRLKSLVNKLERHPDIMEKYNATIADQLDKGIIEKVDRWSSEGIKHYLPHHAVINPQKTTTKLRVVYDASSKSRKENKSLNECLYRGPVLLKDLCGILMRFRLHPVGIVSDIEKAFLQVGLQPSQRDATRFLWFKDHQEPVVDEGHLQEYRFCRVPFGAISSPFLLGATIESHLDTYDSPWATQLKENTYMDNIITGTRSADEAISMYKEAKTIFNDAKMNLREWSTSSDEVNQVIPVHDKAKEASPKVLGHTWNAQTDTLALSKCEILNSGLSMTKRNVLKQVASVFDPLGLYSPVTLRGKVLLQNLWKKHLDWDDALDADDCAEWLKIQADLENIASVELPRCISIPCNDSTVLYDIVCFCDASSKAYATSVYLVQTTTNSSRSDLIFSKCRLAPTKGMTIPRLELMAVLIGVRCVSFVSSQIRLPLNKVIVLTDSQCVLHWISSNKVQPVFVQNRLKEIRSHEDITFRYVNTKENPADLGSRGCSLSMIQEEHSWWHGPTWLLLPFEKWPSVSKEDISGEEISMTNDENACSASEPIKVEGSSNDEIESVLVTRPKSELCLSTPFDIDAEKYSSLERLLRVTAWCIRFTQRLKGERVSDNHLTSDEILKAENVWIRYIQRKNFAEVFGAISSEKTQNLVKQLDLYVDDEGILRCGGRLGNSCLTEAARYPILLPQQDYLTKLFIQRVHKRILHSGVSQTLSELRQKFWVPHGRATVRTFLKSCRICKRTEGGPYRLPQLAPLPKSRVSVSAPFSRCGLDYLGPLYIKENNENKKIWICLFTCMVTRAVHLEVVQDMSANTFLYALRRFIAVRGTPHEIISDNAKHFKLSSDTVRLVWTKVVHDEDVQNYVSSKGIQWSFIVELAPWMGGFYERLVGLVKRALRKTIGRKLLTLDQMMTVVKEAEAVVNSRPLMYVGDDINSTIAVTPRHFLCLNPYTGIPDSGIDDEDQDYKPQESSSDVLLKVWKKGEKLLNTFWQIWRADYLTSLRERTQREMKSPRVQSHNHPNIGDVVLIRDDMPRGQWRMGRLTNLRVSPDGMVRSAEIQTATGNVLRRPLNLLYPVEAVDTRYENNQVDDSVADVGEAKSVKPKRKAAIVARKLLKNMLD